MQTDCHGRMRREKSVNISLVVYPSNDHTGKLRVARPLRRILELYTQKIQALGRSSQKDTAAPGE